MRIQEKAHTLFPARQFVNWKRFKKLRSNAELSAQCAWLAVPFGICNRD